MSFARFFFDRYRRKEKARKKKRPCVGDALPKKHRHSPDVVFDGSHNPEGIAAAAESIRRLYDGRILLLTGVMRDKDYTAMIETLSPMIGHAFCVTPENPRALDAASLAEAWRSGGVAATPFGTVEEAMRAALQKARAEGLPLFILGSLYLYREARDAFDRVDRE